MTNKSIILAAVGGAAAGIAIAIISSEKGKEWLGQIKETVSGFVNERKDEFNIQAISNLIFSKLRGE